MGFGSLAQFDIGGQKVPTNQQKEASPVPPFVVGHGTGGWFYRFHRGEPWSDAAGQGDS